MTNRKPETIQNRNRKFQGKAFFPILVLTCITLLLVASSSAMAQFSQRTNPKNKMKTEQCKDPCAELKKVQGQIKDIHKKIAKGKFPKGKEPSEAAWRGVAMAKRNAPIILPQYVSADIREKYKGKTITHEILFFETALRGAYATELNALKAREKSLLSQCKTKAAKAKKEAKKAKMTDAQKAATLTYNEKIKLSNYDLMLKNRRKELALREKTFKELYGNKVPKSAFGYQDVKRLKKEISKIEKDRKKLLNSRI